MRQSVKRVGGYTLIVDCYNAGPESMKAAFDVAKTMKTEGKKIAVLGTMRELGENAPRFHREAGANAAGGFDEVITLGEGSPWYRQGAPEAAEAPGVEEIAPMLFRTAKPGDLILFKGSRLNYLEKAVEAFLDGIGSRA
ncbi:MAG: UDP-N-acetylmuramoyl-tripeptide--D-alanyl-D-alanine ligase, partial [Clostridia bacterium]|nr:UDP-N-acetylmuramoyl-tripeptide--D-alanyl-D-alanine ligase [Clostridia bacterium]